jgi:DNA primase small subunit
MANEIEFIMNRFRRYYLSSPPPPPDRFRKREFGFMFFDKGFVQRHLEFPRIADFHAFLQKNVPSHCYYSSAYYESPAAEKMEDKNWLGADLIFDLDADHIRGAEGLSYQDMLALVKGEMIRLLDDYILGDLGFDESCLKVTFSGGRGYHAHISDPRAMSLRSHERREIVDYISGTDLSMEWLMPEYSSVEKKFKTRSMVLKTRQFPAPGEGGWKGRLRVGVAGMFDEMERLSVKEAMGRYEGLKGEKEETVSALWHDLFHGDEGKRGRDLILEKNNLADIKDRTAKLFLNLIEKDLRPRLAGQVDEPVTSDIKRLIRLPFSLHGKTGLRVVAMHRSDLEEFDPLRDASPEAFGDAPIKLRMQRKVDIKIRGERFVLEGDTEVPEFAAVFLLCRREATLFEEEEAGKGSTCTTG